MDTSLAGLVYVSSAAQPFSVESLQQLAVDAAQRNQARNITGFLHYDTEGFLQYLEGSPQSLRELMQVIEKDPRHTVLRQLQDPRLGMRRFPSWKMRWLDNKKTVVAEEISANLLQLQPEPGVTDLQVAKRVWRLVEIIRDYHDLEHAP